MLLDTSRTALEPNYINWDIQHEKTKDAVTQLTASNFQDIFSLTRRVGDLEVKMNRIKYRAQGIGGMIGMGAGALGGPLGTIVGFGVGRSIGSFIGNGMAKRYYGEEQMTVNEHLYLARTRDTQLKYQLGLYDSLGQVISTLRQNKISDDKKTIQDMMVL
jgi:hypothetical protein